MRWRRNTVHLEQCLLYDSGELTTDEAADFERHLAACVECRDLLETARAAHRWARGAAAEPHPRLVSETLLAVGGARLSARAAYAAYTLAGLLVALTLARGFEPAGVREELEKLGAEISQVKEDFHE